MFEVLIGLLKLLRPPEWTKSIGNMAIAYIAATGFTGTLDFGLLFWGFLAVGPLLWGGLYTLNDVVDFEKDQKHAVKKNRPIPSGVVSPNMGFILFMVTTIAAFAIGFFIIQKPLFILCLAAMLANQLLYTLKPFELKKKLFMDFVSGSLINPFFRFYSGWFLVMGAFNAPLELVVFVIAIQFGGYSLYRLASKKHEEELNYKSSVVVFGEKKIRTAAYAAITLGGAAYFFATFNGVLPFKYFFLGAASLVAFPLYVSALKNPQEMNMRFVYNLIYANYALFITGFVALAYL
ncbi:MAG: UbiA family prenyltransferase [archaeon]|nr:UbiA family prenyltransferase [archaeon]